MNIELLGKYILREEPSNPDRVNIMSIRTVKEKKSKNYGKRIESVLSYGHTMEDALEKIARLEAGKSKASTVEEYVKQVKEVHNHIKEAIWEE